MAVFSSPKRGLGIGLEFEEVTGISTSFAEVVSTTGRFAPLILPVSRATGDTWKTASWRYASPGLDGARRPEELRVTSVAGCFTEVASRAPPKSEGSVEMVSGSAFVGASGTMSEKLEEGLTTAALVSAFTGVGAVTDFGSVGGAWSVRISGSKSTSVELGTSATKVASGVILVPLCALIEDTFC
jgi:hypothetical protein